MLCFVYLFSCDAGSRRVEFKNRISEGQKMSKKNDKKICWNCDGNVGRHLDQCPYCGTHLATAPSENQEKSSFSFENPSSTPFEHTSHLGHPLQNQQEVPKAPYSNLGVSKEEWDHALEDEASETTEQAEEENVTPSSRSEMIALLLLLPGVVFFLFGLVLLLFSDGGVLTLQWNQSFAYFYFLGALPLLILGWRALR